MPRTTRRNYVQPQIQKTLFAVPASIRHHRQMRRHGSTLHLRFAALRFVGLYRKQSRERILNQTKVDHLKTRGKNLIWYQGSKYQLFPERTANGIRYPAIFDSADTITTAFGPPKNDRSSSGEPFWSGNPSSITSFAMRRALSHAHCNSVFLSTSYCSTTRLLMLASPVPMTAVKNS